MKGCLLFFASSTFYKNLAKPLKHLVLIWTYTFIRIYMWELLLFSILENFISYGDCSLSNLGPTCNLFEFHWVFLLIWKEGTQNELRYCIQPGIVVLISSSGLIDWLIVRVYAVSAIFEAYNGGPGHKVFSLYTDVLRAYLF